MFNLLEAQWQAHYPHLIGVRCYWRRYSSSMDNVLLLFFGLEPVAGRSGFIRCFELSLFEAHILGRKHSAIAICALCPALGWLARDAGADQRLAPPKDLPLALSLGVYA